MNFEFQKNGAVATLSFDGELTSECMDDIRFALMISLGSSDQVVLSLDNVNEMDEACEQLFCKTIRTSERFRKKIIMAGDHSKELSRKVSAKNSDCPSDCSGCEKFAAGDRGCRRHD